MGSNENPQNIIRSWNLQQSFNGGRIVEDKLVPPAFGRIRSLFVGVWREQQLDSTLDWAKSNVSVYLPESLLVVQSAFLRIELPANSGGNAFKKYPGIHAIKSFRILSAGVEVYTADFKQHLVDYCSSLSNEQLGAFSKTYLGHQDTMDDTARNLILPVLLFNSTYLGRSGGKRGHGILPAYLGQTRLEIQITMNTAQHVSAVAGQAPASISNKCSILYHTAEMSPQNVLRYSDLRGSYSIINRRFTELTSGFRDAAANTETSWFMSQPQGTCVEVMLLAYATGTYATEDIHATTFTSGGIPRGSRQHHPEEPRHQGEDRNGALHERFREPERRLQPTGAAVLRLSLRGVGPQVFWRVQHDPRFEHSVLLQVPGCRALQAGGRATSADKD